MEMLVLCNETVGMAKQFVKGIEINSETLALDIIEKVGPGGDFLSEEHTLNNYKEHLWHPEILNRQVYENWKKGDNMTFSQRANQKVKNILNSHTSENLSKNVVEKVKEISLDRN
jgi:trimethylamine--corrinoid protein Co-methyltransferase